jgi:dTDP-4-amino-4,6-dideoxygalactose transaminase
LSALPLELLLIYLRVAAFPADSEIIFSAINIPDMAFIARQHGLRVVPVDIDLDTLGPRLDLLEELITSRTVAILAAHLFGRWFDISPLIDLAIRFNVKVIEDCAEGFCGFRWLGDPRSDLVLFSFGPIKFFTAFGGGIAKVNVHDILYVCMYR